MISEEKYYGGAIFQSISASLDLYISKRVWTIEATAGQFVRVPDARTLKTGGPYFYIINIGSNTFDILDNINVIQINSLAVNSMALMSLADNSTRAGKWFKFSRALVA